jgi:hypothetical protein
VRFQKVRSPTSMNGRDRPGRDDIGNSEPKPYDFFIWSGFGGSGRIVTLRPSVRSTCGFKDSAASLHKALYVYLPRRQVYGPERPNLPQVNLIILRGCGGETSVLSKINNRFIRSRSSNAINMRRNPMAVFGF